MEKFIISINPGGISNRIKCLISLLRLSKKYNRNLILYWPRNHTCGAKFSDLYSNSFEEIKKDFLNSLDKKEVEFYDGNTSEIPNSPHRYIISDTWRFVFSPNELEKNFAIERPTKNGSGIDHEFNRIPKKTRNKILKYLKLLKPKKEIQKKINNFSKKYNLKKMVGVHIRRGDYMYGKEGLGKVSSDDKFFEEMKRISVKNPKIQFFLCTDCGDTEKKYIEEFGKKIVIFPKTTRVRTSIKATQEGLIDLILLSKTKYILGTYFSTFTEIAWWLGGCKAKVKIIKDEKNKKEYFKKRKSIEKGIFLKLKRLIFSLIKKFKESF